MGITGNLLYMLRALLTDRTMQVVSDGKVSFTHTMLAGVPQGSILAPFLFLIYIHDISARDSLPRSILMSLFADDIALMPTQNGSAGMSALQRALDFMSEYARRWKITFSSKKTNVVFFRHSKLDKGKRHPTHALTLTRFAIATANKYTYLGVVLDYFLSFVPHACATIARVSCTTNMISRLVRRDHLPSIPIIRTLVQCVLVPQMVYGFAFLVIENKSVSTTQATGNSTHSNFYTKLKNAILRPLLFCMGLPHNAHHASVFIETRLLNIDSLLSLAAARAAHRWLWLDDTNAAATLFREHIASPPLSALHPFSRIQVAIRRTPGFQFDVNDIQSFREIDHDALRSVVWRHQYITWRNSRRPKTGLPFSLPPHYPRRPTSLHLPTYMHIDDPTTAARRARLRFARARLRFDQKRLGFQDIDTPTCKQCAMDVDETVDHVIDSCSKYSAPRAACLRSLRSLSLDPAREMLLSVSLNRLMVLPGDDEDRPSPLLTQILTITGKYINAIYAEHDDNF
jgi:hypothetical protein